MVLTGRRLLQTQDTSNPTFQLDDITRVDPLQYFKKYRGGYDITNKHYWSVSLPHHSLSLPRVRSVANSGRTSRSPIGSGAALGGTAKFHSRAKTIVSIIIDTADQASHTIHNATGAIKKISETLQSSNSVGDYGVDAASFLASTSNKLDDEAVDIERQARKNRHLVGKGLTILYLLTTINISLNLAAAIALSETSIGYICRFSGDTCTALQDFQQNPENSSLSSILPCDGLLSAKSILLDIGVGVYDIVDQVNVNISLLRSNLFPELEFVCNPFSGPPDYLYQPEKCPTDTVQIGDIPQVLKLFTCSDTSGTGCKQGEFITTNEYNVIEAYTTSIQSLLDGYPEMESLVDCQLVKNAFSDILVNHCKPLKRYVKMTWIAVLSLSMMMLLIVLLWVSTTHHEQKRHFADGSVKPNATEAINLDPDVAKATIKH
ncbi:hypothetical protein Cgig2_027704 [Carnegiea gigantea]|uniref:Uncharacterized protein n=1 Tax=Carnegiea gigantea TaxID=171969 RepID=A0A9Q1JTN2_9CARY|nr:hypothetical protein Cgig2_027704 [Carnegiea gigantea]